MEALDGQEGDDSQGLEENWALGSLGDRDPSGNYKEEYGEVVV